LGIHDHGGMVWDEMVAYWLVVAFVPFHWLWWFAAFVIFRFFDIVKPWPIRYIDQKVSGGFGIMLDDILAAVYTLALLTPAIWWLN
jgi:phosphatidylglycerophosphatase A